MSRRSGRNATQLVTQNALVVQQQQQALSQLAVNLGEISSRIDFAFRIGKAFGGKRDYWDVFGYPRVLEYIDYLQWYERGGIAKPIIDIPRDKCWSTPPAIQEDENQFNDTPFEKGYKELEERFGINQMYKRADILAGIGHYACILVGVRQNSQLNTPLADGALKRPADITYLAPYSEANAKIVEWETDSQNVDFGKPKIYLVNIGNPTTTTGGIAGGTMRSSRTIPVHASRIIHIAEGVLEDEYFGTPVLKAVFNHLFDLLKTIGGGAEIFWLNARAGLKIKVDDGRNLDINSEAGKQLTQDVDNYVHQLKRNLFLDGVDAQTLVNNQPVSGHTTHDPIMQQIAAIARIPKRILIGSEQGEQASTQDRINFAETNMSRRVNFCGPGIVIKAAKHFIRLGALAKPAAGPFCIWQPLLELDQVQRSTVATNLATAAQKYATNPETQLVYAPGEFRQTMGLDAEMSAEMRATIVPLVTPKVPTPPDQNLPVVNDRDELKRKLRVVEK